MSYQVATQYCACLSRCQITPLTTIITLIINPVISINRQHKHDQDTLDQRYQKKEARGSPS